MDANAIQRLLTVKFSSSLFLLTASTSALHAGVDFNHQIVPLLRKHCAECHTGDKLKGGFSMNDRAALLHGSENGPVVEPGKTEKSLLLDVVTTTDEETKARREREQRAHEREQRRCEQRRASGRDC